MARDQGAVLAAEAEVPVPPMVEPGVRDDRLDRSGEELTRTRGGRTQRERIGPGGTVELDGGELGDRRGQLSVGQRLRDDGGRRLLLLRLLW